jgi:hypothetical protein
MGTASGTIEEERLKLATLLYEKTIFPVGEDHLRSTILLMSAEENAEIHELGKGNSCAGLGD